MAIFRNRSLGRYLVEEEAAWAYNVAVYGAFGKEARFNDFVKPRCFETFIHGLLFDDASRPGNAALLSK